MTLKYYYDFMSQPSRALHIIFKISGTEFEDCPVALRKGVHKTEAYKNDVNRFQLVPCINDDGFKLSESVAIVRYLSAKGQIKPDLYPSDLKLRARVDEYLEWQHLNIRIGCAMYFRKKWLEPYLTGKEADPKQVESMKIRMVDALNLVENIWFESTKFIAGDSLTVADIFAACEIEQTTVTGYDPTENRPKLKQWIKTVKEATNPYYDVAHNLVYMLASTNVDTKL